MISHLSKFSKRIDKLESEQKIKSVQHLTINDDFSIDINYPNASSYVPLPTGLLYHKDNKSLVKITVGPFGSGKSSFNCAEIIHKTAQMPPMSDGVRRARWAIVRNTLGDLESTTMKTWDSWWKSKNGISYLGRNREEKKPVLRNTYSYNDQQGALELELIFLGLDREDQIEKLDSLELTGAYINELQHIPKCILTTLIGRVGRFPKTGEIGDYYHPVLADTNPPDTDHWIYIDYEMNPTEEITIYHQPPGLIKDDKDKWSINEDAENLSNVGRNYYYQMAAANKWDEEYIKVKCNGDYGITKAGKPVYHEYNDRIHMLDNIEFDKDLDIDLFWDYGLTPCVLFIQMGKSGQFRAIKEFCTERSGLKQFAQTIVIPYLTSNLKDYKIGMSIGDPAGEAAQDTDANYCHKVLKDLGLLTMPALTNKLQTRLEAVKHWLSLLIDGYPGFVISARGCPLLRKALLDKYCYERKRVIGPASYQDKPSKTHPWSDIANSLEYAAMYYKGQLDLTAFRRYHQAIPTPRYKFEPKNKVSGY